MHVGRCRREPAVRISHNLRAAAPWLPRPARYDSHHSRSAQMTRRISDRLFDGARAAAAGVLLVLLLPLTASASQPALGGAQKLWAMQSGDDPRWSRPDFDASAWPRADVRSTWRGDGRQGYG